MLNLVRSLNLAGIHGLSSWLLAGRGLCCKGFVGAGSLFYLATVASLLWVLVALQLHSLYECRLKGLVGHIDQVGCRLLGLPHGRELHAVHHEALTCTATAADGSKHCYCPK